MGGAQSQAAVPALKNVRCHGAARAHRGGKPEGGAAGEIRRSSQPRLVASHLSKRKRGPWAALSSWAMVAVAALSGLLRWRGRGRRSSAQSSVAGDERLQHVRNQRGGIDCLAIRLSVQRSVAVDVGFQAGRAGEGELDALGLGPRPEP